MPEKAKRHLHSIGGLDDQYVRGGAGHLGRHEMPVGLHAVVPGVQHVHPLVRHKHAATETLTLYCCVETRGHGENERGSYKRWPMTTEIKKVAAVGT